MKKHQKRQRTETRPASRGTAKNWFQRIIKSFKGNKRVEKQVLNGYLDRVI